jgi:hypothetical protein
MSGEEDIPEVIAMDQITPHAGADGSETPVSLYDFMLKQTVSPPVRP